MRGSHIFLVSALVVLPACPVGRHVGQGMEYYSRGELDEAKAKFEDIESFEDDLNAKGYVRYLVYRGLTHYELGEEAMAARYLREGRGAYQRGDSRWLPPNIAAKMEEALTDLGE